MNNIEGYKYLFQKVEKLSDGIHFGHFRDDKVLLEVKNGILTRMIYSDQSVYNAPCPFTKEKILVLNMDRLTTKERAVELANSVGNKVLTDRAMGREINSSNDVAQLVIDRNNL